MSHDIELGKEALKPLGDLLHKLCAPLAEEMGEGLGVWARHYRFKLALKMLKKTERMLKEAGIEPQGVPPRLFLPILENASVEDDEDLHSRWAALLANAAASGAVHPSFIEILKQLSPEDARALDELYDSLDRKASRKMQRSVSKRVRWSLVEKYGDKGMMLERVSYGPRYHNLIRLGLIDQEYRLPPGLQTQMVIDEEDEASALLKPEYKLARFVDEFVEACRPPKKSPHN